MAGARVLASEASQRMTRPASWDIETNYRLDKITDNLNGVRESGPNEPVSANAQTLYKQLLSGTLPHC